MSMLDNITNFNLSNIGGFLSSLVGMLKQAGITTALGLGGLGIMFYFMHNISVEIWELKKNNILKIKTFKAKKVTKGGSSEIVLFPAIPFFKSKSFPVPEGNVMYMQGGKEVLKLFKISDSEYKPIEFNFESDSAKFTPIHQEMMIWNLHKQKEIIDLTKKPNMLQQYLPAFMFIVCVVVIMILIMTTLDKIDSITVALNGATANVKNTFTQTLK